MSDVISTLSETFNAYEYEVPKKLRKAAEILAISPSDSANYIYII